MTMPKNLLKAHQELDKLVDKAYRKQPFQSEMERIQFLFALYQKYIEKEQTEKAIKSEKKPKIRKTKTKKIAKITPRKGKGPQDPLKYLLMFTSTIKHLSKLKGKLQRAA